MTMMSQSDQTNKTIIRLVLATTLYVNLYLVWSRASCLYAQQYASEGYFFVVVIPTGPLLTVEFAVRILFAPLIFIDTAFGGPFPSSQPMMELSSKSPARVSWRE